jgi:hypothetical protein
MQNPLMVVIISPMGWWLGLHQPPWSLGSIPKREEPGKTGRHPVLKYRVPHGSHCVLLRSAKLTAIGNNTLTIRTFLFSPPLSDDCQHKHTQQPLGLVSFQARCILPVAEEQSRTRGSQSGGVEDQPQCRGLWHSSSPSARSSCCSLSRSPSQLSPPPPSFTQSPSPPRSLVRDGQPSPHRPRLVVSRSTCPPLSPSPHANSFIKGNAVINTHTHHRLRLKDRCATVTDSASFLSCLY